jgi:hypothetical protein
MVGVCVGGLVARVAVFAACVVGTAGRPGWRVCGMIEAFRAGGVGAWAGDLGAGGPGSS